MKIQEIYDYYEFLRKEELEKRISDDNQSLSEWEKGAIYGRLPLLNQITDSLEELIEQENKEYSEIENLIIKWSIDGTKTAGYLTRQIMGLLNNDICPICGSVLINDVCTKCTTELCSTINPD